MGTKEERIYRLKVNPIVCRNYLKGDVDDEGFCTVRLEVSPDNPEDRPIFKRVVFPGSDSGPTY